MRRLLLTIAMCSLMTACGSGVLRTPDPDVIEVKPQANLTAVPKVLPQPPSGQIADLEANHREVAKAYHDLASQMCRLLAFLQLPTEGCEPWTKNF
jgi:hypothetical protein